MGKLRVFRSPMKTGDSRFQAENAGYDDLRVRLKRPVLSVARLHKIQDTRLFGEPLVAGRRFEALQRCLVHLA